MRMTMRALKAIVQAQRRWDDQVSAPLTARLHIFLKPDLAVHTVIPPTAVPGVQEIMEIVLRAHTLRHRGRSGSSSVFQGECPPEQ